MKQSTLVGAISAAGLMLALNVMPAMGAVSGSGSTNSTTTTSTSSTQFTHDTRVNVNLYSTRVLGLASWTGDTQSYGSDGFVNKNVYDATFQSPIGAQEVQHAFTDAYNAVQDKLTTTGGRGQIQMSSSTSVASSTSTSTVEDSRTATLTLSMEESVGPGTIIIGDRDNGGTAFQVLAGTVNVNINTHTQTDIFTTTTATTTTDSTYTVTGELYSSPIVLDLVGSGNIEASQGHWQPHPNAFYPKNRRLFDFFGNGFPVAMEWVGPTDGLLVQPKADGSVDGSCLFGNASGYTNGYEHLASLDANLDGKVSGKELTGLSVWQDKNGNAKCESGELSSVKTLGISEFNLKHSGFKSTYTINGKTQAMFDWWPTMFEIKKNKQPV